MNLRLGIRSVFAFLQRAWLSLIPPRLLKAAALVLHSLVLLVGLVTLYSPPVTVALPLGPHLTLAWAAFFILGGSLGVVSVMPGKWALERIAILSSAFGWAIYLSVIIYQQYVGAPVLVTTEGTAPIIATGSRLTSIGMILIAGMALVFRAITIRGLDTEPRIIEN